MTDNVVPLNNPRPPSLWGGSSLYDEFLIALALKLGAHVLRTRRPVNRREIVNADRMEELLLTRYARHRVHIGLSALIEAAVLQGYEMPADRTITYSELETFLRTRPEPLF